MARSRTMPLSSADDRLRESLETEQELCRGELADGCSPPEADWEAGLLESLMLTSEARYDAFSTFGALLRVLANQERILKNQERMLANQEKMLAK